MIKGYFETNMEVIYPNPIGNQAIWILEIGKNTPPENYKLSPTLRDMFVIHYIVSGKGHVEKQHFQAPCGIMMSPNTMHQYNVDSDCNDFRLFWIKVTGPAAKGFLMEAGFPITNEIFPVSYMDQAEEIFSGMFLSENYDNETDRYFMLQHFFALCSLQAKQVQASPMQKDNISPYTQKILKYIHENYFSQISEKDLAEAVNLSVRYMHKRFKKDLGVPPIKYLNSYRLKCAEKMLTDSTQPISKIVESCGYTDPAYFCSVFKKYSGVSPSKFRKK